LKSFGSTAAAAVFDAVAAEITSYRKVTNTCVMMTMIVINKTHRYRRRDISDRSFDYRIGLANVFVVVAGESSLESLDSCYRYRSSARVIVTTVTIIIPRCEALGVGVRVKFLFLKSFHLALHVSLTFLARNRRSNICYL
jgi:hypothetical protein